MRISDWSSDVCSSDLTGLVTRPSPGFTVLAVRCQVEGGENTVDHCCFARGLWKFANGELLHLRQIVSGNANLDRYHAQPFGIDTLCGSARCKQMIEQPLTGSAERRVGKEGVSTCRFRG